MSTLTGYPMLSVVNRVILMMSGEERKLFSSEKPRYRILLRLDRILYGMNVDCRLAVAEVSREEQ